MGIEFCSMQTEKEDWAALTLHNWPDVEDYGNHVLHQYTTNLGMNKKRDIMPSREGGEKAKLMFDTRHKLSYASYQANQKLM